VWKLSTLDGQQEPLDAPLRTLIRKSTMQVLLSRIKTQRLHLGKVIDEAIQDWLEKENQPDIHAQETA
jgi:hypothetical protein